MMMSLSHNFHDNHDQNCDCQLFLVDNSVNNVHSLEEHEEFYMYEIRMMKYRLKINQNHNKRKTTMKKNL